MPKGHRAGRKYQLRRLALKYRLEAAENSVLLGVTTSTIIRKIRPTNVKEQGSVVAPGDWALPKANEVAEIDAVPKEPVVWKLIPID